MQIVKPYPDVPGDNADTHVLSNGTQIRPRIMARGGYLVGVRGDEAVWGFGFSPGSEAALAYEREMPELANGGRGGFFVRATIKTGKIRETFRGYALEMPATMRKVIDG